MRARTQEADKHGHRRQEVGKSEDSFDVNVYAMWLHTLQVCKTLHVYILSYHIDTGGGGVILRTNRWSNCYYMCSLCVCVYTYIVISH